MNLYTRLFDFEEDFTTFQDDISSSLIRSGLLLDEHEFQIIANFEINKLLRQNSPKKQTYQNQLFLIVRYIMSFTFFRNISRCLENHYKALFNDLIQCCRNQSILNLEVKRHFERRLSCMKVLDVISSLRESTLLREEIQFLSHFSMLLTQTNESMIMAKKFVINAKMKDLGFQLFETKYLKGCDLDECFEILKLTIDMYVYNTSEMLTAVVLSFLQPFKFDDSIAFYHLNVVIPNLLRSSQNSLEESRRKFETVKYLLMVKDETNTSETKNKDTKFVGEDLINYNISETLRNLQLTFELVTKIHKNYNKDIFDISDKDLNSVKSFLKKTLENVSYLDKLVFMNQTKVNEGNTLLPSVILAKEPKKIAIVNNLEEDAVDEVFSCFISDNTEVPLTKQYDDLFQNFTSQQMLIAELQEKLDLLTNLKGRKIAPEPGDQILPTAIVKEQLSKQDLVNVDEKCVEMDISLAPPVPPKMPVNQLFDAGMNSNYRLSKTLAKQVKEIANRNKREEEVFGSDSSTDSYDEF